jgi:hypothetical protein
LRELQAPSAFFSPCGAPPFVKCSKGKGDPATVIDTNWVIGLGKIGLVDQMTHNVLKRVTS